MKRFLIAATVVAAVATIVRFQTDIVYFFVMLRAVFGI